MIENIQANGINMAYRFDGPETGPVVMLRNSLMSNYTMWDPQMAVLTKTFRVLRYDTRGHGQTDAPAGPYTIKLMAEDAVALLDALKIDKVHFAGLSMGEAAAALEIPRRTADRNWAFARAWLFEKLRSGADFPDGSLRRRVPGCPGRARCDLSTECRPRSGSPEGRNRE